MKIIKIEKEEKEYFIVYKKNNEIFTVNGNEKECLNKLKKDLYDK